MTKEDADPLRILEDNLSLAKARVAELLVENEAGMTIRKVKIVSFSWFPFYLAKPFLIGSHAHVNGLVF